MKAIFIMIFIFIAGFSHAQILTYDNLKLGLNIDAYYAKNSIGKEINSHYYLADVNEYIDSYLNNFNYTTPVQDAIRLYNVSLTASYTDDDIKGKATLQYGDIIDSYYTYLFGYYYDNREFIREANLGFSPVNDLWIEGGIYFQPFSAEPTLPGENFLTSTAVQSKFEPQKLYAAKISYSLLNNLSAGFIVSDGYSVNESVAKNKHFGFMLDYSPLRNLNIKLNNLTGNVYHRYIAEWEPYIDFNTRKVLRVFNNAVLSYTLNSKLKLISGIDVVLQEKSKLYTFEKAAVMFSGFISGRYQVNKKFSVSARGEYTYDRHGIFTFMNNFSEYYPYPTGIETAGFAVGVEYSPKSQLYARLEMNYLQVYQKLGFSYGNDHYSKLTAIASMGLRF